MNESSPLHVVFGSGQVGSLLAGELAARGLRVRVARRAEGPVPRGAELVRGDAGDAGFCKRAAEGAAVIYHCMNPAYSTKLWSELIPRFTENLITAAGANTARLVVLDNLYLLGPSGGRPLNEDTPSSPVSKKGVIRAAATRRFEEADRDGRARVVIARASDFYGPGGEGSHFGPTFWRDVFRGKPGTLVIPPDAVHTYHYIPDVARGLAALGTAADDVLGKTFMLPCAPAETARALVARFSAVLGREIPIRVMPRPLLSLLGWFVPILGELREMLYQWDAPFVIDDARFRARFPEIMPAPQDEAARATVEWAQQRFGA